MGLVKVIKAIKLVVIDFYTNLINKELIVFIIHFLKGHSVFCNKYPPALGRDSRTRKAQMFLLLNLLK
jgi:hypothetical protein